MRAACCASLPTLASHHCPSETVESKALDLCMCVSVCVCVGLPRRDRDGSVSPTHRQASSTGRTRMVYWKLREIKTWACRFVDINETELANKVCMSVSKYVSDVSYFTKLLSTHRYNSYRTLYEKCVLMLHQGLYYCSSFHSNAQRNAES